MGRLLLSCILLACGLIRLPSDLWSAETAANSSLSGEKTVADDQVKSANAEPSDTGTHELNKYLVRPEPNRAELVIDAALRSPTRMEFKETPLSDVIEFLKDMHKIEIQLDKKALEDAGISSDTPVTLNLKGVSLRSSLRLMLGSLGLTWTICNEVLLITTPETAEQQVIIRVYDVADLVVCRDSKDRLWDDYQPLVDIITASTASVAWDCGGGPGSIRGASLGTAKVLVIGHTRDMHDEIAGLLANIRAVAAKKSAGAELPRRDPPAPAENDEVAPARSISQSEAPHALLSPQPPKPLVPTLPSQASSSHAAGQR